MRRRQEELGDRTSLWQPVRAGGGSQGGVEARWGSCAFVGSTGRRCNSRHQVQLHHLDPFARGGRATAANLTLRCRVHNHHAAEQDYGAEQIARKVASHRARRNPGTSPTIPGLFG
jgi:hypothetical protein